MKLNYIGIFGGALEFISLALPWWTLSATAMGWSVSLDIYLYTPMMQMAAGVKVATWFIWLTLVFVILSGIFGVLGSITEEYGEKLLIGGGLLTLLSLIIFVLGLQTLLGFGPTGSPFAMEPPFVVYSQGSYRFMDIITIDYLCYLSFGFWLALGAAITQLFASTKT